MEQQIIEAILENGQIKSVNKELPRGILKVHLIYNKKDDSNGIDFSDIISETSGIYRNINVEEESRKLRSDWDRDDNI